MWNQKQKPEFAVNGEDPYAFIWEQYNSILRSTREQNIVTKSENNGYKRRIPGSPFTDITPNSPLIHSSIDDGGFVGVEENKKRKTELHDSSKSIQIEQQDDDCSNDSSYRTEEVIIKDNWERHQRYINERRYTILSDRIVNETREFNLKYMNNLEVPNNIIYFVMNKWDEFMVFERSNLRGNKENEQQQPPQDYPLNYTHECNSNCNKNDYIKCLHPRHDIYVCSENGRLHVCRADSGCNRMMCSNEYSEIQCGISGKFISYTVADDSSYYKTEKDKDMTEGDYGGGECNMSDEDTEEINSMINNGISSDNSLGGGSIENIFFSFNNSMSGKTNRFGTKGFRRFNLDALQSDSSNGNINSTLLPRHYGSYKVIPLTSDDSFSSDSKININKAPVNNPYGSSRIKQRRCFNANEQLLFKSAQSIIFDLLYNNACRARIDHRHVKEMEANAITNVCKYYKNCNKNGTVPVINMVDSIYRHYMNRRLRLKTLKFDGVRIEYYARIAVKIWKFIIKSPFAKFTKNESKFHFRSHVLGLIYMMKTDYTIPIGYDQQNYKTVVNSITPSNYSAGQKIDRNGSVLRTSSESSLGFIYGSSASSSPISQNEDSGSNLNISQLLRGSFDDISNLSSGMSSQDSADDSDFELDDTIPQEELDIINGVDSTQYPDSDEENISKNCEDNDSVMGEKDNEYGTSFLSSKIAASQKKLLVILEADEFLYHNLPSESDLKDIPLCERDDKTYSRNDITKGTNNIKDSIKSVTDIKLLMELFEDMKSTREKFRNSNMAKMIKEKEAGRLIGSS
jgi:hypothetical protein